MTIDQAAELLRETLRVSLLVSAPFLAGALGIGLVISILQAATQVNEQTLTFVPKIVAVLGITAVLFPWMMRTLVDFSRHLLEQAAQRGGP
jgi:flagellar biosynthetic protein FliQ